MYWHILKSCHGFHRLHRPAKRSPRRNARVSRWRGGGGGVVVPPFLWPAMCIVSQETGDEASFSNPRKHPNSCAHLPPVVNILRLSQNALFCVCSAFVLYFVFHVRSNCNDTLLCHCGPRSGCNPIRWEGLRAWIRVGWNRC